MPSDTALVREQIVHSLEDKEYRDAIVEESINQGIAFQIRATRASRGWTQDELGSRADKKQSEISRLEDPDYEGYTLKTLTRLASAFDVALIVKFVPFSTLVDEMSNPGLRFDVVPFSEDVRLRQPTAPPDIGAQTALPDPEMPSGRSRASARAAD